MVDAGKWVAALSLMALLGLSSSNTLIPVKADTPEAAVPSKKISVPAPAALKEDMQTVDQVYQNDLQAAKNPEQKAAVCHKLLNIAQEEKDDSARFALLSKANDMAIECGDFNLATAVIDRMDEAYLVDALQMKVDAATSISKAQRGTVARQKIVAASVSVVDKALGVNRFDIANAIMATARSCAQSINDAEALQYATTKIQEIKDVQAAYSGMKPVLDKFSDSTSDPDANLKVGKFKCFISGDWDGGLPLLARGSDAKLKALAENDLEGATDANVQMVVGDGWWSVAEKENGRSRKQLQKRACMWYSKAIMEQTGLAKVSVEARLKNLVRDEPTTVIGKWRMEWIPIFSGIKYHVLITIKSNGRCVWEDGTSGAIADGSWKTDKDKLILSWDNGSSHTWSFSKGTMRGAPTVGARVNCIKLVEDDAARQDEPDPVRWAARARPVEDPMDYAASKALPPLHELLGADEYQLRFTALWNTFNPKSFNAPEWASNGLLILEVVPGSQAQKLGIKVGDVLTKLGAVELGWAPRFKQLSAELLRENHKLEYWSPEKGACEAELDGGRLGVTGSTCFHYIANYGRSQGRDKRWDDHVIVALLSVGNDALLSETALFHARQAGCTSPYLALAAGLLRSDSEQYDDCFNFLWPTINKLDATEREPAAQILGFAAKATFKLEQAWQLHQDYPVIADFDEQFAPHLDDTIAAYRTLPKTIETNPIAGLRGLRVRDLTHDLKPDPSFTIDPDNADIQRINSEAAVKAFSNGQEPYTVDVETDRSRFIALGPAAGNVELSANYQLKEFDGNPSNYYKGIVIHIYDTQNMTDAISGQNQLIIEIGANGTAGIHAFGNASLAYNGRTAQSTGALNHPGIIHVVILGNRCEVVMDGRRLYYGYVPLNAATRKFGLSMQCIGVRGTILNLRWREIIPAPVTK